MLRYSTVRLFDDAQIARLGRFAPSVSSERGRDAKVLEALVQY